MSTGTVETRTVSILAAVNIFDVLEYYETQLVGRTTQQIPCPVHADRSPSARVYGDGNKVYCFKCAKLWDVITLVQAKERCQTERALDLLESWFKIAPLSENLNQVVKMQLKRTAPLNLTSLFEMVEEGMVAARSRTTLDRFNRAWLAFDILHHQYTKGQTSPEDAQEAVKSILRYVQAG